MWPVSTASISACHLDLCPCSFPQNARVSVMGSGQLSQVMKSVSRSVMLFPRSPHLQTQTLSARAFFRDPSQHASLQAEIEAQSASLYATARLWDDGIIKPTDTRDVVGLGLALAARQSTSPSRPSSVGKDVGRRRQGIRGLQNVAIPVTSRFSCITLLYSI
jgi:hypothetical protein